MILNHINCSELSPLYHCGIQQWEPLTGQSAGTKPQGFMTLIKFFYLSWQKKPLGLIIAYGLYGALALCQALCQHFTSRNSFNPHCKFTIEELLSSFTDDEIEAQKSRVTCPKAHSHEIMEPEFNPNSLNLALAFSCLVFLIFKTFTISLKLFI